MRSPLGFALDFRVDRLADPLAMAALSGIVKELHDDSRVPSSDGRACETD
jgi:hypothetical protein